MSPEDLDLPRLDARDRVVERIRRRGQRELRRWSDPFARTPLGRLERTWILRLEPMLAGAGAAALVAWAFAVALA